MEHDHINFERLRYRQQEEEQEEGRIQVTAELNVEEENVVRYQEEMRHRSLLVHHQRTLDAYRLEQRHHHEQQMLQQQQQQERFEHFHLTNLAVPADSGDHLSLSGLPPFPQLPPPPPPDALVLDGNTNDSITLRDHMGSTTTAAQRTSHQQPMPQNVPFSSSLPSTILPFLQLGGENNNASIAVHDHMGSSTATAEHVPSSSSSPSSTGGPSSPPRDALVLGGNMNYSIPLHDRMASSTATAALWTAQQRHPLPMPQHLLPSSSFFSTLAATYSNSSSAFAALQQQQGLYSLASPHLHGGVTSETLSYKMGHGSSSLVGPLPPPFTRPLRSVQGDPRAASAVWHDPQVAGRINQTRYPPPSRNAAISSSSSKHILRHVSESLSGREKDSRYEDATSDSSSIQESQKQPTLSKTTRDTIATISNITSIDRERNSSIGGGDDDGSQPPVQDADCTTRWKIRSYPLSTNPRQDAKNLSPFQCMARRQIELFEASSQDAYASAQGRNKAVGLGQVGIRCRHCAHIHRHYRKAGSIYFPTRLHGVYQTAQKLIMTHLCRSCPMIPDKLRLEMLQLKRGPVQQKSSPQGGGKKYWAYQVAKHLNVIETEHDGLRFRDRITSPSTTTTSTAAATAAATKTTSSVRTTGGNDIPMAEAAGAARGSTSSSTSSHCSSEG